MACIADAKDVILPVFGVGINEYEEVKAILAKYPTIDTSGIFTFQDPTNVIHFWYNNGNETDCSKNVASPIPFSRILFHLNKVDGVYINMQSGFDITLETLDYIRLEIRSKRVPIHLDMHNVTLGVNPDGTRFRRAMSDWRRWCFMTDFVQMNEDEAKGITIEGFADDLFAKQMMPLMVKAFFVTRGTKGMTIYQDEHKHLIRKDIEAKIVEEPTSAIGSGDIFGSTFLWLYTKSKNILAAAEKASSIASISTQYKGEEKFVRIKEALE